jgi:hypothetical protein
MEIDRIEWLREARQPHSYRQMYGLVVMIIASPFVTTAEKRMAMCIRGLLKDVLELAVASASILSKVRIGFPTELESSWKPSAVKQPGNAPTLAPTVDIKPSSA